MREMYSGVWKLVAGLVLVLLVACEPAVETSETDRLLAKVGNKSLYLSEMEGMFPGGLTEQDSSMIIEQFVARWARETALLNEAEKHLPRDFNIDKMVRDYRASLLRSTYEEVLIRERLDSTVSEEQLLAHFNQHSQLYLLEQPIVRCMLLKVPSPTPEAASLREWWADQTLDSLRNYANRYAEVALLSDSTWYRAEEIVALLPPGTLTVANIHSKKELSGEEGLQRYFFRLLEVKRRTEKAPLSFVEDRIRKRILHERKQDEINTATEDLYERELRENRVDLIYLEEKEEKGAQGTR